MSRISEAEKPDGLPDTSSTMWSRCIAFLFNNGIHVQVTMTTIREGIVNVQAFSCGTNDKPGIDESLDARRSPS